MVGRRGTVLVGLLVRDCGDRRRTDRFLNPRENNRTEKKNTRKIADDIDPVLLAGRSCGCCGEHDRLESDRTAKRARISN